jgi:SAM-dependent methyltransferase
MRLRVLYAAVVCLAAVILTGDGKSGAFPQASDQGDLNHALSFGVRDGRKIVTGCSERIVEIPFVHRNLPYPFRGRLLDVGYRESEITYETSSLGFETWGIDIRPPLAEYPGVKYILGDVIQYPFDAGFFDVVIALSTVEHIGLMAYGNAAKDPDGDLHALKAIHRILKPRGRLLLTVPFGKRGATNWYRVYDQKALLALLKGSGFAAEIQNCWLQEGIRWMPAPWQKAEQVDSITHHVKGVVCVVARPVPKRAALGDGSPPAR